MRLPAPIPHAIPSLFLAIVIISSSCAFSTPGFGDDSFSALVSRARQVAATMYPLEPTAEQYTLQQRQARLWENPTITLQGGGMKENREGGATWSTSLLQPIPLYGKRDIRAKQVKISGDQASRELRQQQLAFEHSVAIRLYELWGATEEQEHSRFRAKILTPIKTHLAQVPALSPLQTLERSVVDLRCHMIDQQKQLAEERVLLKGEEVAALLGIAVSSTHPPLPRFSSSTHLQATIEKLQSNTKNPLLLTVQDQSAQALLRASLAKTASRPDLGLAIGTQSQLADSTQHGALVGVQMTVPLWNTGTEERGARAAEQRAVQAQISATDRLVSSQRRLLQSQLQETFLTISQLSDDWRKSREEQLQQSMDALLKGFGDIKLFLELEAEVATLHERYIAATLQFAKTWSELLIFEGMPFMAPQESP